MEIRSALIIERRVGKNLVPVAARTGSMEQRGRNALRTTPMTAKEEQAVNQRSRCSGD